MTVPVQFDVWGCRGSRNLVPNRSSIGNRTSCYSILGPESLVVLDAGRGIAALGSAMLTDPRFAHVKEIHVLLTHAHLDHFEGLKDVDWFWKRGNGLSLVLHGTEEALSSVATVFAPPIYVTLPVLADGTLGSFTLVTQRAGDSFPIPGFTVDVFPLYHYSGIASAKFALDTIGYRVASTDPDGPVVAYLSDHEPTRETAPLERAARSGAHLVIYDAHFLDVKDHAFGHGSQEYTAGVARAESSSLVLAGHLSPNVTDTALHETRKRHGEDVPNFALAAEGDRWQWDEDALRFLKV
ncbi:MAG: hypothetical protein JNK60_23305, partial [Acidobacteria bacterium]|nr:hypothetical protein [Acidobacteriota bacterium]